LKKDFPKQLSFSRFIEIEHKVFILLMFFISTACLGKCTGITFVDNTKISVCNNKRIKRNRVFKGVAKIGRNIMGWFYGFKLHLICNDRGELLSFCLTTGNVDDRNPNAFKVLMKKMSGKIFDDREYTSSSLFEMLLDNGIHPVTGIKAR
jgi:hypothetical protein